MIKSIKYPKPTNFSELLNYVDELYIYKQIFEFKFKLITKFMELLQKHRERTLKLRESFPIWGYYDSDYKF